MAYKKKKIEEMSFNPFTTIGKDWLLISAKKGDCVNTMTASWGGIGVLWSKNVATVYIRPQRYTKEFIDQGEYFTLTFFDDCKKELGILGSKSGRDSDKIKEVGFTVEMLENQPTFKQGKMVMICKKIYHDSIKPAGFLEDGIDAKHYPSKDYHELYIGEIISVYENEKG